MNALATFFGAGWTLYIVALMVLWFFFPFVIFSINNKLNDTNEHLSNVISELKKLNDKWSWDNKESLILFHACCRRVLVERSTNDRRINLWLCVKYAKEVGKIKKQGWTWIESWLEHDWYAFFSGRCLQPVTLRFHRPWNAQPAIANPWGYSYTKKP